jgi:hypothetical protein
MDQPSTLLSGAKKPAALSTAAYGRGQSRTPSTVVAALVALTIVGPGLAAAQDRPSRGTVVGLITDARTRLPLSRVEVWLGESTVGSSDAAGRFIVVLDAGPHVLRYSLVGYAVELREVLVPPGAIVEQNVELSPGAGVFQDEVTVVGSAAAAGEAAIPAQVALDARELNALRGVLVDDAFRAIQAAPGVATGDDFRAEFAIRGLGPRHQTVLLDGVDVPGPIHRVGGLEDTGSVSMVSTDILQRAVVTSSASPKLGVVRLGGTVDLLTRDTEVRPSVRALIGPTAASLTAAGPLGEGSWLVSARRSYLGWLLSLLDEDSTNAFGFTDAFAKAGWSPAARQSIKAWVLSGRSSFRDREAFGDSDKARATSATTAASVEWSFANSQAVLWWQQLSIVDSGHRNETPHGRPLDTAHHDRLTWRGGARRSGEWGSLDGGLDVRRDRARLAASAFDGAVQVPRFDGSSSDTVVGTWLHARVPIGTRALVAPGVRVERSGDTGDATASAWAHLEWAPSPRVRTRLSFTSLGQLPEAEQMALSPDRLRPEIASSVELSAELDAGRSWTISVGGFRRLERDLAIARFGEARVVDGIATRDAAYSWESAGRGRAGGIDARATRTGASGINGWVAYSFLSSTTHDVVRLEQYPGDWSQRHTVSAFWEGRLSSRTSLGVRWRLGVGAPVRGYVEQAGGEYYLAALRNQVWLPAYSRVDVRLDHVWQWGSRRVIGFAEVVNVLNRRNVGPADGQFDLRYGRIRGLTEYLFPLLPTVGLILELR